MAQSDPSDSGLIGKGVGCGILFILLGIGSWILPLFGIQFSLVAALGESLGVTTPLAGLILVGAGLLLSIFLPIVGVFFQPSSGYRYGAKITPELLQRVIPYLPEISSRVSNGETFEMVVEDIANKEHMDPKDVTKAIIAIGSAYRQAERKASEVDE